MLLDGVEDRRLKLINTAGTLHGDLLLGQVAEEALDHVQPGGAGGRKWRWNRGWWQSNGTHRTVLVGAVVVSDQVNFLAHRRLPIDLLEEPKPLPVAVWRGMQLPITAPSTVLNAANNVVVPWRLT